MNKINLFFVVLVLAVGAFVYYSWHTAKRSDTNLRNDFLMYSVTSNQLKARQWLYKKQPDSARKYLDISQTYLDSLENENK